MKGVVLAAGKGVRMRELTQHAAKALLPVANKPILFWTLEALHTAGVREALLVVGHLQDQIRDRVGDGAAFGMRVEHVTQPKMHGTGEAAMCAREFAGDEPFVLAFSDIVTPPSNFSGLVREFERHAPDAMLTTRRVEDPWTGAAVYVENSLVTRIVEKPPQGTSTTHFDNAGLFVFTPLIFELLDRLELSPRGEYELTDALRMLAEGPWSLRAYELEGFWSNVTSPEELLRTNRRMLAHLRALGELPDAPGLHPLAIAHETARLGDCVVGENVALGPNSTVGNAAALTWTVLSDGARIGEDAVVEYAFLMPNAEVPPGARIVGRPEEVKIVPARPAA